MTDEVPDDADREGADEEAPLDDEGNDGGVVRSRGSDGELHKATPKRKQTGDSELDQLWALRMGELQAILDDPDHPLHEKAQQVADEMTEPIRASLEQLARPILDDLNISDSFARAAAAMLPDTSWVTRFGDLMPKVELPQSLLDGIGKLPSLNVDLPLGLADDLNTVAVRASSAGSHPAFDLSSNSIPDITPAEFHDLAEDRELDLMEQMIGLLSDQLVEAKKSGADSAQALEIAQETLDETRRGNRSSTRSVHAGWWAAGIAAVGAIATVVFGLLTLHGS